MGWGAGRLAPGRATLLTIAAPCRHALRHTHIPTHSKLPQDRVVDALLNGGADVHVRNRRGRTPAHVAALFNRHGILDRVLGAGACVMVVFTLGVMGVQVGLPRGPGGGGGGAKPKIVRSGRPLPRMRTAAPCIRTSR